MRYGPAFPYAGARPLQEYYLGANDTAAQGFGAGYTGPGGPPTSMPNGLIVPGFDNYWGGVEFLYAAFTGAVSCWAAVSLAPALVNARYAFVASALANTANQARSVAFNIAPQAAGQWGWVAVSGFTPVLSTATIAANTPMGITGAGTLGASSAGKEIENLNSILPATTTVAKNASVVSGQPFVQITGNNTIDGLFLGCAVSGTGIPAGAVVATLDPDGRRFTMSAGPGLGGAQVTPTQSGGIVLTGTYNDGTNFYNIAQYDRPFAQGRIT
jgi:hypothetical protein